MAAGWLQMAATGRNWPQDGCRWLQMAADDCRWPQMAAGWLQMAADGRNRPQLAAGWLQVAAGVRRCGSRCEQSLSGTELQVCRCWPLDGWY